LHMTAQTTALRRQLSPGARFSVISAVWCNKQPDFELKVAVPRRISVVVAA
jgi:hypothetical protein